MKNVIKLLNALNKVEANTREEKIIKNDGLYAMWDAITEIWPSHTVIYVPGKGYRLNEKKAKRIKRISQSS